MEKGYVMALGAKFLGFDRLDKYQMAINKTDNNTIEIPNFCELFLNQGQKVFCEIKSLLWYKKFLVQKRDLNHL